MFIFYVNVYQQTLMLTIRINNHHPITENSQGLLFEFVEPNTYIAVGIQGDKKISNKYIHLTTDSVMNEPDKDRIPRQLVKNVHFDKQYIDPWLDIVPEIERSNSNNITCYRRDGKGECNGGCIIKKGIEIHRIVMIEGIGKGAIKFYIDIDYINSDGMIDIKYLLSKRYETAPVSDFHLVLSLEATKRVKEKGYKEISELQHKINLLHYLSNHIDKKSLHRQYLRDGLNDHQDIVDCDSTELIPVCSMCSPDNSFDEYNDSSKRKTSRRERFGLTNKYNSTDTRFDNNNEVSTDLSLITSNIKKISIEGDDILLQLYLENYYITRKIIEHLTPACNTASNYDIFVI